MAESDKSSVDFFSYNISTVVSQPPYSIFLKNDFCCCNLSLFPELFEETQSGEASALIMPPPVSNFKEQQEIGNLRQWRNYSCIIRFSIFDKKFTMVARDAGTSFWVVAPPGRGCAAGAGGALWRPTPLQYSSTRRGERTSEDAHTAPKSRNFENGGMKIIL